MTYNRYAKFLTFDDPCARCELCSEPVSEFYRLEWYRDPSEEAPGDGRAITLCQACIAVLVREVTAETVRGAARRLDLSVPPRPGPDGVVRLAPGDPCWSCYGADGAHSDTCPFGQKH